MRLWFCRTFPKAWTRRCLEAFGQRRENLSCIADLPLSSPVAIVFIRVFEKDFGLCTLAFFYPAAESHPSPTTHARGLILWSCSSPPIPIAPLQPHDSLSYSFFPPQQSHSHITHITILYMSRKTTKLAVRSCPARLLQTNTRACSFHILTLMS